MRIGIDLDNVVYPFVEVLGDYISLKTGCERSEMPPAKQWEFFLDWGLTAQLFLEFYAAAVDDGYMFTAGAPIVDSQRVLRYLENDGHTIHLVTDRHVGFRAKANTEKWLAMWEIPHDSLTFSADKTIVRCDVFLDDKPSHVDDLRAVGCSAYLMDCGREDQVGHPHLVSGWDEFYKRVGSISKPKPSFGWDEMQAMFKEQETRRQELDGEQRVTNELTGGQKGQKLARTDLIPPDALLQLAEHYGKGSGKYEDRNWEKGVNWSLNYSAALRHLFQFWGGEDRDTETGSLHVIAAAWHCLALATFHKTHPELDDRPS